MPSDVEKTLAEFASEAARATWQYRAIAATRGNQSKLGTILIAILGRQRQTRPQFGSSATITSDGFVMSRFIGRDGEGHEGAFVCGVADLTRNFRGLADHLKLRDGERGEMFTALRQWIALDYRANKDLDL